MEYNTEYDVSSFNSKKNKEVAKWSALRQGNLADLSMSHQQQTILWPLILLLNGQRRSMGFLLPLTSMVTASRSEEEGSRVAWVVYESHFLSAERSKDY